MPAESLKILGLEGNFWPLSLAKDWRSDCMASTVFSEKSAEWAVSGAGDSVSESLGLSRSRCPAKSLEAHCRDRATISGTMSERTVSPGKFRHRQN